MSFHVGNSICLIWCGWVSPWAFQVNLDKMFWSKPCSLALAENSPLRAQEPHFEGIKRFFLKMLLFYSKQSKSIRGANVVYQRILSQVDKPPIYEGDTSALWLLYWLNWLIGVQERKGDFLLSLLIVHPYLDYLTCPQSEFGLIRFNALHDKTMCWFILDTSIAMMRTSAE